MALRTACVFVAVVALAFVAGCDSPRPIAAPPPGATVTVPADPPPPGTESAAAATGPRLVTASWNDTEKLIAQHKGQVVVVDFWSTWCAPCVREFPNLVKIHEQFAGKVACLSVNCNYSGAAGESAEDAREEVLKFLTAKKANFTNVLCTDADTDLLNKLKAAAVPIVRVYDKQGQLRKQFINDDGEYGDEGFEYAKHIEPLVEMLVAE